MEGTGDKHEHEDSGAVSKKEQGTEQHAIAICFETQHALTLDNLCLSQAEVSEVAGVGREQREADVVGEVADVCVEESAVAEVRQADGRPALLARAETEGVGEEIEKQQTVARVEDAIATAHDVDQLLPAAAEQTEEEVLHPRPAEARSDLRAQLLLHAQHRDAVQHEVGAAVGLVHQVGEHGLGALHQVTDVVRRLVLQDRSDAAGQHRHHLQVGVGELVEKQRRALRRARDGDQLRATRENKARPSTRQQSIECELFDTIHAHT